MFVAVVRSIAPAVMEEPGAVVIGPLVEVKVYVPLVELVINGQPGQFCRVTVAAESVA